MRTIRTNKFNTATTTTKIQVKHHKQTESKKKKTWYKNTLNTAATTNNPTTTITPSGKPTNFLGQTNNQTNKQTGKQFENKKFDNCLCQNCLCLKLYLHPSTRFVVPLVKLEPQGSKKIKSGFRGGVFTENDWITSLEKNQKRRKTLQFVEKSMKNLTWNQIKCP